MNKLTRKLSPFCLFFTFPMFLSRVPLTAPNGCRVGGFIGASVAIASACSADSEEKRKYEEGESREPMSSGWYDLRDAMIGERMRV